MTLSTPAAIQARLEEIEQELAVKQNECEDAALEWFRCKRDREHDRAVEYMRHRSRGATVADSEQLAVRETAHVGAEAEGRWEGLKLACKTLDTRAAIGMSLLRAQSRA